MFSAPSCLCLVVGAVHSFNAITTSTNLDNAVVAFVWACVVEMVYQAGMPVLATFLVTPIALMAAFMLVYLVSNFLQQ